MKLRKVRLAVSTIVFILITAIFLDIPNRIPPSWSTIFLSFQFAPALIKTFTAVGFAFVGVIFILLLTVFFGRLYCSHLCPLGTLQDIVIWFKQKKSKHRKFPYHPAWFTFHYLFTALVIILAFAGSLLLLDLFEPFSNYGRMLTALVRPVIIAVNNYLAILLTSANDFGIAEIPLYGINFWNLTLPFLFLVMIVGLAYWRGRLFCNLLCPVGGVLSLLSRISVYKITIKGTQCIDCGLCERVCRAECIDSKKGTIDFAACVGCFDCIGACPTNGMSYKYQRRSAPSKKNKTDRRIVLMGLSAALIDTTGIRNIPGVTTAEGSAYAAAKKIPAVPPGGLGQDHFAQFCTACHRCISACPTHVLQPSFLEYGFAGILQPKMDYDVNYCNFDCTLCGEVCPTGAILPLVQQEKKLVQIGKVTFVKEDCIVATKKKDCGACAEHCPTKAVKMVPYGKLTLPEIDNQYCVGCGACEHACPTIPRRAIYVTPNPAHLAAKKREEIRIDAKEAVPVEFPF
jgi:ferredoxin-type protein NapF